MLNPKALSHYERLHNPKYAKVKVVVPSVNEARLVETTEYDESSERMITRSEFKRINRQKEMEMYKCSDFSLENLQSLGMELHPAKVSPSTLGIVDNIDKNVK